MQGTSIQAALGLIPARAGNTSRPPSSHACTWAHPRSRGEHCCGCVCCGCGGGSSPLARGTRLEEEHSSAPHGLIPARAGNTANPARRARLSRAHPRSRGEHTTACRGSGERERWGSSPLARGTREADQLCQGALGLIPARAGNTNPLIRLSSLHRAHPRSRGEHLCRLLLLCRLLGSSPLARGTPTSHLLAAFSLGLIPARAGNTPAQAPTRHPTGAHPRSRGEHDFSAPC